MGENTDEVEVVETDQQPTPFVEDEQGVLADDATDVYSEGNAGLD